MSAALLPAWLDDPAAANDPTWHLGEQLQTDRADLRKGNALVQSPTFVVDLVLDLTYVPAVEEFGLAGTTLIDPSCGTGNFLTAAFMRLAAGYLAPLRAYVDLMTADTRAALARDVLRQIAGVDIDPDCIDLARHRLTVLADQLAGLPHDDPDRWPVQLACTNSLLDDGEPLLRGQYQAVVGNPPYITCKDAATDAAIRRRYPSVCHRKYSLAVPFEQLMHELAAPGGWVGRITANSFMKREFGKKLIESYFPTLDLQWVIDTSGAYIPGHGTPTVVLISRNRPPAGGTVRTVLGVRGEPGRPEDPALGVVWTAIVAAVRERLAADVTAPEIVLTPRDNDEAAVAVQEALFDEAAS
jgi:type I restriction-modification system DNA methylase subunit